jgi:hypothetical protein
MHGLKRPRKSETARKILAVPYVNLYIEPTSDASVELIMTRTFPSLTPQEWSRHSRLFFSIWMNGTAFVLTSAAIVAAEPVRSTTAASRVSAAWQADFGDEVIIYRRVPPRALPALRKLESAPLNAQEAAAVRAKALKLQTLLFLSCTVYDRRVTEMRWEHEGRRYRAWSNIDGNYLRGLAEFETADTVYSLMLGIGEASDPGSDRNARSEFSSASGLNRIPLSSEFVGRCSYILADGAEDASPAALAGLNALHAYFDSHRTELIEAYETRLAAEAERQRKLALEPRDARKTIVIDYWRREDAVAAGVASEKIQR